MVRWPCPPATEFEIRALAVWGRAHYFSVTDFPRNIESVRVSGEETCSFFDTWELQWGLNPWSPTFQAGSFNHCTRAPALDEWPITKQPRDTEPMLGWCWPIVYDADPTSTQHWFSVSWLLWTWLVTTTYQDLCVLLLFTRTVLGIIFLLPTAIIIVLHMICHFCWLWFIK